MSTLTSMVMDRVCTADDTRAAAEMVAETYFTAAASTDLRDRPSLLTEIITAALTAQALKSRLGGADHQSGTDCLT